ncbi:hypothetical protein LguiA_015039 [Lonicera macranthoides]
MEGGGGEIDKLSLRKKINLREKNNPGEKQSIYSQVMNPYDGGMEGGGDNPYESGYVHPVAPFPLVTGRYFSSAPHNCYTFDLPSGFFYSVRVFFGIQIQRNTAHLFNVSIKGTVVANLNSNWNQHLEQTFLELAHFLQNGDEFICFHRRPSSPSIMFVEVFHLPHFFPFANDTQSYSNNNIYITHIRLNFGSNISIFDRNLDFGDRFWKGVSLLCDNGVSVRTSKSILVPRDRYPSFLYETGIVATFNLPNLRFLIRDIVPMKCLGGNVELCGYAGLSPCSGKNFGVVLPLIVVSVLLALLVSLLVLELRSKTVALGLYNGDPFAFLCMGFSAWWGSRCRTCQHARASSSAEQSLGPWH